MNKNSGGKKECQKRGQNREKKARVQCFLEGVKIFVLRPTYQTSMAQGFFKMGLRPTFPKMPRTPSAFNLKGTPQAPGDKHNPPKRVKACGDGSLRPEVYPVTRHSRPEPPIASRPAKMCPINWICRFSKDREAIKDNCTMGEKYSSSTNRVRST